MKHAEPVVNDPTYFVGTGLHPVGKSDSDAAKKVMDHFRTLGLPPDKVPWVMMEFILDANDLSAMNDAAMAIAIQMSNAKVFIPAPVDPDIKMSAEFCHPFRVGLELEQALIIGAATDAFYKEWLTQKVCYVETHLWVRTYAGKEACQFLWTVLHADQGISVVVADDKPVIVPIDSQRGYVCRWAKKMLKKE